jgi:hypothetical protein
MSWNYRVMCKAGQFAVYEVFYAEDGRITGFTSDPVFPRADDPDELAEEFERYRRALTEPILDFAALEAEAEKRRSDERRE